MLFSGGLYQTQVSENGMIFYKMNKITGNIEYCIPRQGCKSIQKNDKSLISKIFKRISENFKENKKAEMVYLLPDKEAKLYEIDSSK